MLKRILRKGVRLINHWLYEDNPGAVRDAPVVYPWINAVLLKTLRESSLMRPAYLWEALHGAHLAKTLGLPAVSLIEFGVAGGNGLVALDLIAQRIERIFGIQAQVYGFDTGAGLPAPQDLRDCPNLFAGGDYPMDVAKLRSRLTRADLILGKIDETLPAFMAKSAFAPVAFISVDVDLYSSAKHALHLLGGEAKMLLPRIHCYFDDITGFTYTPYNGERLAIEEFNQEHPSRKISPIFGARHYVPKPFANEGWVDKLFMAHIFDHELYGRPDGLGRIPRADLVGKQ